MSTLRVVGIGIAWNTIASVGVKLFALTNVFLALRHLSVYEYGLSQLVISVFATISGILLPGLGAILISDLARDRGMERKDHMYALARQYFALQTFLGVAMFVLMFVGSYPIALYMQRPEIGYYLKIMAGMFLTGPLFSVVGVLAAAEFRFRLQSSLSFLYESVKFSLLLVFFYVFDLRISGVLYSMVGTPLLVTLFTLPWSWNLIRPLVRRPSVTESIFCIVTPHRLWGMASAYVNTLTQTLRVWFIQLFLGTEAVALYSFAQGLYSQAIGLITFGSVTSPVLSEVAHNSQRLGQLTTRTLKYHVWVALCAVVPGILVTPLFIETLFPQYVSATGISMLYLLALIPASMNVATSAAFTALQQQREYFFKATLVRSLAVASLNPPLLLAFKIMGTAIEPVVTLSLSTAERVRALRKLLPAFAPTLRSLVVFDATDRALLKRLWNKGRAVLA